MEESLRAKVGLRGLDEQQRSATRVRYQRHGDRRQSGLDRDVPVLGHDVSHENAKFSSPPTSIGDSFLSCLIVVAAAGSWGLRIRVTPVVSSRPSAPRSAPAQPSMSLLPWCRSDSWMTSISARRSRCSNAKNGGTGTAPGGTTLLVLPV